METNSAGAVTQRWKYFPFGREVVSTPQTGIRLRFTGHERDLFNTGGNSDDIDYMHARYMGPVIGRFMSTDPATPNSQIRKRPQLWNRFSYVADNPLRFVDPTGERIEITPAFFSRWKSDAPFGHGYVLWRTSAQGKARWATMRSDKNTTYRLDIGATDNSSLVKGSPPEIGYGATGPVGFPLRQTADWKNDAAEVLTTINVERHVGESSGDPAALAREYADMFMHESLHAVDFGAATSTPRDTAARTYLLDVKRDGEPSLMDFRLEIGYRGGKTP